MGYFEPAISLVDSSRHFLKYDSDIPPDRRGFYLKFINFIGELAEAKGNKNKLKMEEIKRKLSKSGYFIEKEWLDKKLDIQILC